jgi:hypothetical protein
VLLTVIQDFGQKLIPLLTHIAFFYPPFATKKSGEVIGMAGEGQSIKPRFGK